MVIWQLVHLCTDTVKLLSFFNIIWNISCFSNSYPTWWSSTQQFPSWHLFSSEPRKTSSTVWTKQSGRVQTFTALLWWRRLCSFTERHWARWGWWENRRNGRVLLFHVIILFHNEYLSFCCHRFYRTWCLLFPTGSRTQRRRKMQ